MSVTRIDSMVENLYEETLLKLKKASNTIKKRNKEIKLLKETIEYRNIAIDDLREQIRDMKYERY